MRTSISCHLDVDISCWYTGTEEVRVMARTVVNLNDRDFDTITRCAPLVVYHAPTA
jgi:hypothetical protein